MGEEVMEPLIDGSASLIMQAGFGGVCVILFGLVIWLIKLLVSRIDKSNSVIAKHTDVSHGILKAQESQNTVNKDLRDELLKRPCMSSRSRD